MRNLFLPALLALGLSTVAPAAQCVDPPADGNFIEHNDLIVSFTDNYRTYMDVRIPTVAPGPCGWPMIVLVHTSGTSRDIVNPKARILAGRGFVTVTYDVRGQGPGMTLNDPRFFGREILGMRERLDLFEIMEEAEKLYPASIDFDRIGVTGRSQGAFHSFVAAGHSGKTFSPNPWRTAPAPVIRAVAPVNFGPEHVNGLLPEGQNFSEMMARQLFEDEHISGLHNNPTVYSFIAPYLANNDFLGLVTAMYNPTLDLRLLLQDSAVPIMAQMAWDDKYGAINELAKHWDEYLLPGTPKYLNHSTTGHSTAINFYERFSTEYRRIVFFEHELKGIDRNVDEWAKYRFAITPLDATDYNALHHIWDVIESDVYPLAGTETLTMYLGPGNALQPTPPASADYFQLHHETHGITMQHYFDYLPEPAQLAQGMPLETIDFVMPALPEGVLMLGTPKLTLHAGSLQQEMQISVALFDHTNDRYLTSGFTTIRDNVSATELDLELEMGMCAYYLPKGTVLRAEIRNLAWHQTPFHLTFLRAMPIFSDFDLGIRVGGAEPARLELPLINYDNPVLTYNRPLVVRQDNPTGKFALRCYDETSAGWNYQILGSFSGTSPGTTYMGTYMPLNIDVLTELIYRQPFSLPISDFSGQMDQNAEAFAEMRLGQIPTIPHMVSQLDFCAVMVSPSGSEVKVSNVVHLEFD
ncbi:MAG: hypothetical protein H8E15_10850 [Planctomycetes bacterium]|nr:hypothetical protein [Planctomycetota bacterium]